jgi:CubicO group peptidase (beta-lactamase class C family)
MRSTLSLMLVVTAVPSVCGGSADSPEAIEEERALGVVQGIQVGDAAALLATMRDNWVPAVEGSDREARLERMAQMLTERHAGLEIVGVEITQPHKMIIVTESAHGPALQFGFDFEAEPPYRIASMSVEAGGGPRHGPELPAFEVPERADGAKLGTALQNWFDGLSRRQLFSGTALVAWRGEPIFSGAWGLASHRWNMPNRVDTRFDLGSINKSFTKIAVAQLASTGRLSFDDTIARHLPDYPNGDAAKKITVRHLLEHTSGLGDIFTDDYFRSSKALYRGPRDFFPLFANEPLRFEPGERSEYSNAGYMVLGAIIEAVSGEPYDQYVQRHVFEQARMGASGFFAKDEPEPAVAVGYTRRSPNASPGELRNNLFNLPIRGNPAGSAYSTVEDLLRFDNALREHVLLPPPYTAWYFGGAEPEPGSESDASATRAMVGTGIAGGAPGVSAVLDSDGDLAVIVLSNYDPPIAESIARHLFRPLGKALRDAAE